MDVTVSAAEAAARFEDLLQGVRDEMHERE
jgi:hypothetical protein